MFWRHLARAWKPEPNGSVKADRKCHDAPENLRCNFHNNFHNKSIVKHCKARTWVTGGFCCMCVCVCVCTQQRHWIRGFLLPFLCTVWILAGRTEGSMLVCEFLEWQEDFRFDRTACRCRMPLKRSTTEADRMRRRRKRRRKPLMFPLF